MNSRTLISFVHKPVSKAARSPVFALSSLPSSSVVDMRGLRSWGQFVARLRPGFAQQQCQHDGERDTVKKRREGRLVMLDAALPAPACRHQRAGENRAAQSRHREIEEV